MRLVTLSLIFLTLCCTLVAQTFDVASVKEITDYAALQSIKSGDITFKGGNLYMHGVTLGYAVQWAYDIQRYQLDGPDWMNWRPSNDQPRYEISAKTDPSTPKVTAQIMAQHLLAERFGLVAHFEDRMKPGYSLREDVHGLKIQRIEPSDRNPRMAYDRSIGKVSFTDMNMEELCGDVALTIGEPVVDRTSLGKQTFNASAVGVLYDNREEMVSALFSGLKRDIGLVAVREKVPVKTVVVDQINQHPTMN
jgi:uncharacterized protein (TIGR03435 family)